jgi:hypothetical protein
MLEPMWRVAKVEQRSGEEWGIHAKEEHVHHHHWHHLVTNTDHLPVDSKRVGEDHHRRCWHRLVKGIGHLPAGPRRAGYTRVLRLVDLFLTMKHKYMSKYIYITIWTSF